VRTLSKAKTKDKPYTEASTKDTVPQHALADFDTLQQRNLITLTDPRYRRVCGDSLDRPAIFRFLDRKNLEGRVSIGRFLRQKP